MRTWIVCLAIALCACTKEAPQEEVPGTIPTPTAQEPTPAPVHKVSKVGDLPEDVEENSGMAFSPVTNRLYTVQDSGNPSEIWITEINGKLIKRLKLKLPLEDWEGLAWGPCPEGKCIFVGDIGDNSADRDSAVIYRFQEPTDLSKTPATIKMEYTYAGGPTNAEGLAVHPKTGEIYILSKNYDRKNHKLYQLEIKTMLARPILTLPLGAPLGALSIAPSGEKFLVIESGPDSDKAWESDWKGNVSQIKVKALGQQESAEYLDENAFLYSTEGGTSIMQVRKE